MGSPCRPTPPGAPCRLELQKEVPRGVAARRAASCSGRARRAGPAWDDAGGDARGGDRRAMEIDSRPAGASVFVDGNEVGRTPLKVPDVHRAATRPGRTARSPRWTETVQVAGGKTTRLAARWNQFDESHARTRNGIWYDGESAGAAGETGGEVVFNTSMTGYQEVLTDPSYSGQIVTMTCPEIGNYGVAGEDVESRGRRWPASSSATESPMASNWRAEGTLRDYLVAPRHRGDLDIDTRALTRSCAPPGSCAASSRPARGPERAGRSGARAAADGRLGPRLGVTCAAPFDWQPTDSPTGEFAHRRRNAAEAAAQGRGLRLRDEVEHPAPLHARYGCDVRVFPATAPASELLATNPDGVFLSNGPGDPAGWAMPLRTRRRRSKRTCRPSDLPRPPDPRAGARRRAPSS